MTGSGTELDPFIFSSSEDLDDMRLDIGATGDLTYYEGSVDLDMSGFGTFSKIAGEAFVSLDMKGFSISNLTIDGTGDLDVGLFQHASDECLFDNINFVDPTVTGEGRVGVLAGDGSGIINSVSINGATLNASDDGQGFGVLFGRFKGTITNTEVQGTINTFDGGGRYGGMIGQLLTFTSTIDKCFAVVNIVENGTVTDVGGFVGISGAGGFTMDNCFWDTDVGPATDGANSTATGKTTAEMQDIDTFTDTATTGLDEAYDMVLEANHDGDEATAIWFIDDGADYPKLWFEFEGGGAGATLEAQTGSYSITGKTADLLYDRILESQTGSYSVSGKNSDLLQGYKIQSETGSYAIGGKDADLLTSRILSAETGSYAIDGKDASVLVGYVLPSETGNYLIDGKTANLIVSEVGAFTLSAEKGNYAINGKQANLIRDYIFELQKGTYSVDGKDASILKGFHVSAEKGEYTLTGKQVDLLKDYILSLAKGSYQIDGKDANFTIISVGDATEWSISANELYSISLSEEGLYTISLEEKELYIIKTSANEILD